MKTKKDNSIDTSKVGKFLKGLTGAERIYLSHTFNISQQVESIIKRFKLTKEQACTLFRISDKEFEDFVVGNYNYSLHHIAYINAAYIELEKKEIEKHDIVSVVGSNNI